MKRILLPLSYCCFMLCACGHSHDAQHEHEHEHTETPAQDAHTDVIVMTKEKAKSAGVKVEVVSTSDFNEVITVGGHLLAAANDEAAVTANVAGIVSMPRAITEGMKVHKGMTLFHISAEKVSDGDPAQKAQVAYLAAQEEYERAERLVKEKLVTLSEFNSIKERYETARIAYEATAEHRKGQGIAVKAPIDGYVRACNVRPGDYVNVGSLLADIVRNNRLYLQADVPLRYHRQLAQVESAKFITEYSQEVFDTKQLNGLVRSFGRTATEDAAFLPITFEVDYNAALIPGAFAKVHLVCGTKNNVIALPVTAITEEEGLYFAYVEEGKEHYSKREVKPGSSDGERVEICSGLQPGEKVVTEGAIHVKLASISHSIPGHKH